MISFKRATCFLACAVATVAVATGPLRPAEPVLIASDSPDGSMAAIPVAIEREAVSDGMSGTPESESVVAKLEAVSEDGRADDAAWRLLVNAKFERLCRDYACLAISHSGLYSNQKETESSEDLLRQVQDITDSFVDIGAFGDPDGGLPQGDRYRPQPEPPEGPQRIEGGLNQGIDYRDPVDYTALVREFPGTRAEIVDLSVRNENLNRQLAEEKLHREGEPGQRVLPPQEPAATDPR